MINQEAAGKGGTNNFTPEGRLQEPGVLFDANVRQVSEDYFQTIGIALRQGRPFVASNNANTERVVIINERMAQQYWPNSEALGKGLAVPNAMRSSTVRHESPFSNIDLTRKCVLHVFTWRSDK